MAQDLAKLAENCAGSTAGNRPVLTQPIAGLNCKGYWSLYRGRWICEGEAACSAQTNSGPMHAKAYLVHIFAVVSHHEGSLP